MARPLNELLSAAHGDLVSEYERVAGDVVRTLAPAVYMNVLRHCRKGEVQLSDIPKLSAISKRAAKWEYSIAERRGWLAGGHLTDRGRAAIKGYELCFEQGEKAWTKRVGRDNVARLRSSLVTLVRQFDLELPHHPTGYGPADGSVTGGVSMRWGRAHALRVKGLPGGVFDARSEHDAAEAWEESSGGRLYVRETGQDWRPVVRENVDSVSALSMFALLSQALMAFGVDYEGCGGQTLSRSGNFLRAFGDGIDVGVRLGRVQGKPVPLASDGSIAALVRHEWGSLEIDARDKKKGRFTLTEKGRNVRDAYDDVVAAIEKRWMRRYGASTVRVLRKDLSAVVPT